jgi:glycosyltransferase involved in cell wall biosynthesis
MTKLPTPYIVDEWGVGNLVIHHNKNEGANNAINTGHAVLTEQDTPRPDRWFTWVSSDNVHYPNWAQRLLAEAGDDVGAVYSAFMIRYDNGVERKAFVPHTKDKLISGIDSYYGPSFIIRSDVWTKDIQHRQGLAHDYDHWLRIEERCFEMGLRIVGVDEPLVMYRLKSPRPQGIQQNAQMWRMLGLARRRKAPPDLRKHDLKL